MPIDTVIFFPAPERFDERRALEDALDALSQRFNGLIGACLDGRGQPIAPAVEALQQATTAVTAAPATDPGLDPDERRILQLAIKALRRRFDEFVGACTDANGQPVAPPRKALMQARACLPPSCSLAFPAKDDGKKG